jgi:microcystin-dependent protein
MSFSWCNDNPAGRVSPPDDLINNGFKSTTFGNNFWLNFLFWIIGTHVNEQAGTVKIYAGASYPGALPCAGDTFGSADSGATYASDDYEDLFYVLWGNAYVITGGQGISKEADWTANKPMELPDYRGKILVGYSPITTSAFNVPVGTVLGAETVTLDENELPVLTPTIKDPGHVHSTALNYRSVQEGLYFPDVTFSTPFDATALPVSSRVTTGITVDPIGGGLPHNNIQPSGVDNFFVVY